MKIAICLPTKGRPSQMKERVNDLLLQEVPEGAELMVVLSVIESDEATVQAAKELVDQWFDSDVTLVLVYRPDDSTSVDGWNRAYNAVADLADWFVLGADDLLWGSDWLKNVTEMIEIAPWAEVIGLNDTHTDLNKYAPHYMARADFCRDVLQGNIAPIYYHSWWFDREVCEIAMAASVYLPGWPVIVEHTHPDWKTAEVDDTYSQAEPLHDVDRATYLRRQRNKYK